MRLRTPVPVQQPVRRASDGGRAKERAQRPQMSDDVGFSMCMTNHINGRLVNLRKMMFSRQTAQKQRMQMKALPALAARMKGWLQICGTSVRQGRFPTEHQNLSQGHLPGEEVRAGNDVRLQQIDSLRSGSVNSHTSEPRPQTVQSSIFKPSTRLNSSVLRVTNVHSCWSAMAAICRS